MQKRRRMIAGMILFGISIVVILLQPANYHSVQEQPSPVVQGESILATEALSRLEIKGRAPTTGYTREQFGSGWARIGTCDIRNLILARDMQDVVTTDGCKVSTGTLQDPYTGTTIRFLRGPSTSDRVQIDHVVALSDAWQKGAQYWAPERREEFANDPLELLAVDGAANQNKSNSDAATWLPPNKSFRCQYVARQIAIKAKYLLWVTAAEYAAMGRVLEQCPQQRLPANAIDGIVNSDATT